MGSEVLCFMLQYSEDDRNKNWNINKPISYCLLLKYWKPIKIFYFWSVLYIYIYRDVYNGNRSDCMKKIEKQSNAKVMNL